MTRHSLPVGSLALAVHTSATLTLQAVFLYGGADHFFDTNKTCHSAIMRVFSSHVGSSYEQHHSMTRVGIATPYGLDGPGIESR